jgi:protocatechuate 3,4-dioxygenase beta subunit
VNGCNPLPEAVVDIWQCNAVGVYSAFRDTRAGFDTREQKFLRGYQITNDHGEANFLTIYPGWYPGRAVHIHFKIQTTLESGNVYDFTSQLFFDESLTDEIHSHPPYTDNGQRNTRNENDRLYRRSGDQLMLHTENDGESYTADFTIALDFG